MRIRTIVLAALALSTVVLAQTLANPCPMILTRGARSTLAAWAVRRIAVSRPGTNAWQPSAALAAIVRAII